jgi:hypothetical protein
MGDFRDANVSALLFDLSTKANSYNLYGDFKYSLLMPSKTIMALNISKFHKTSGK